MTKKSLRALKKIEKFSPTEKLLGGAIGVAIFPLALTLSVYKDWDKRHGGNKKRRRRRR